MKYFYTFIFTFFISYSFAQFNILEQYQIGGNYTEELSPVTILSNGDRILKGNSNSDSGFDKTENSRGGNDIWLVRTNSQYDVIWDKTIGGSSNEYNSRALYRNDTIFIAVSSNSPVSGEKNVDIFGGFDIWLLALNEYGDILWQKSYGGSSGEIVKKMIFLPNGNIGIGAESSSPVSGNKTEQPIDLIDFWIIEVSPQNGEIQNQKVIGSNGLNYLNDMILTPDNRIILRGLAATGISGDKTDAGYGGNDVWIVELDLAFNKITDKCFGGDDSESEAGEILFVDNSFYIGITTKSGASGNKTDPLFGSNDPFLKKDDNWLVKTDENFNILWDKTYGGYLDDQLTYLLNISGDQLLVFSTSNSNEVAGNKTTPNNGETDQWLILIDKSNGDIINQYGFGGSLDDIGSNIIYDEAGYLDLAIYSNSGISGDKTTTNYGEFDCWIVRLDLSDYLNTSEKEQANITVQPNPFNSRFNLSFEALTDETEFTLTTTDGKVLFTEKIAKGSTQFLVENISTKGLLFYTLSSNTVFHSGKIISQ